MIYVPLVRQAYEYSCGAASLASCLYYWGKWDGREPELYNRCGTTDQGTASAGLIKVAKEYGLRVSYKSGLRVADLKRLVSEGKTVILSIQAWGDYKKTTNMMDIWEDGHYVVLVGFRGAEVMLMDPGLAGTYRVMPVSQLLECWHDWSDTGDSKEFNTGIILSGRRVKSAIRPIKIAD